MKQTYGGAPPAGVDLGRLSGHLIVLEGPDSSGRTTQIAHLSSWIEAEGFAVVQTGLKRSRLVAPELEKAQQGNVMGPRTMSLFYATDFYDQLENCIIPALQAGMVVLADRYIYTLIVRDLVRGANRTWLESLYSKAIVPDRVFRLDVPPEALASRMLKGHGQLDYWESGMDLGISRDWYESFVAYHTRIRESFETLTADHPMVPLDGTRSVETVQDELRRAVGQMLDIQPLAAR